MRQAHRLVALGVVLAAALGGVARATAGPVVPRVRAVALPGDFMWPIWASFDHTPEGRGTDWDTALRYE